MQDEGLFDEARKKPLPVLPRCIGVVTSPTGAAIRDILRVLKRRFANVHVQLYPVKVQGDGAAGEIAAALRYFNRVKFADVLIVARGGGSLEDLWAFNEEIVARAIAASDIPVITGVGHETDFTIADFVADVRAPTPSAAAEIVVRSRQEFERHIAEYQRQLVHHMRYLLSERRHRVRDLETHRGFRQLEMLVRRRRQQVDELSNSLAWTCGCGSGPFISGSRDRAPSFRRSICAPVPRLAPAHRPARFQLHGALERSLAQKRRRFSAAHLRFAALDLRARVGKLRRGCELKSSELRVRMDRLLVARRRRVEAATLQLRERSPFQLLERGYAIAYDAAGRVLRSPDQVEFGRGRFPCGSRAASWTRPFAIKRNSSKKEAEPLGLKRLLMPQRSGGTERRRQTRSRLWRTGLFTAGGSGVAAISGKRNSIPMSSHRKALFT